MDAAIQLSKLPIIERIQELKARIDELRPLDKETEGRIFQKFRLDWNFHSNAIEGNTLDYGETVAFLMHNVTAKGKPFKDYIDLKGHDTAINYVNALIKDDDVISEKEIRALHEIILQEPYEVDTVSPSGLPSKKQIQIGSYKTSPNHVKTATGAIHYYATPEETPAKMHDLMDWYNQATANPAIHPVVLAALFHHKFVAIHPFDDGNGRLARILMNLIIMKNGYPPIIIKQEKSNRASYYMALSQADVNDLTPFVELIAEQQIASLELYLKGALGESIEDPDDLDKEIELFKKELESREDKVEKKKTPEVLKELYENSIIPWFDILNLTIKKFQSLFFETNIKAILYNQKWEFEYSSFYYTNEEKLNMELLTDNFFSNRIESVINNGSHKSIGIAFQLEGFKTESNTFGLEVITFINLDDYKYKINYNIQTLNQINKLQNGVNNAVNLNNKRLFTKYYHQHLS